MIRLITGGARSGKSRFATSLLEEKRDVVYIATAKVTDEEMKDRIAQHRKDRPSVWRTYEADMTLIEAVGEESNYLLDCVTVYLSNVLFSYSEDSDRIPPDLQRKVEGDVLEQCRALIEAVRTKGGTLHLVTNEVGSSVVPEHALARAFRDMQGRVNQVLAQWSDEVYLVCCGIEVKIK